MAGPDGHILLLEPPFHRLFHPRYGLERFPLSLGYLAGAVMQQTRWRVTTLNADFVCPARMPRMSYLAGEGFARYRRMLEDPAAPIWREMAAELAAVAPDVVGISVKSQNLACAARVAELARKLPHPPRVILGGPHAAMVGEKIFADCPDAEIACVGEAERTLGQLLSAISAERPLDGVPGLLLRRPDGGVSDTGPRELIENLEELPFPHRAARRTLRHFSQYPREAFGYVFATRGCPRDCLFCGSRNVWTRRVRFRSPQSVLAEIRELRRMGLRHVHFDDDTFGVTRPYLRELCAALRDDAPDVTFSCEIHVSLVDEQTTATMHEAGCTAIQLGVESGSDDILEDMRKGFTVDEARRACEIIARSAIRLDAFFMVGFPTETEATLAETRDLMAQIAADRVIFSIFTPYPGTEAFELCRREGLIGEEYNPALHNHQSPENCFCRIPPARFRAMVDQIERLADRRNARRRRRELFSPRSLRRATRIGWRNAIRKGFDILRGK